MLKAGEPFPDFTLSDQNGKVWTKADLLGSPSVVYFYPKDDTPGCTVEACDFRDRQAQMGDVRVFGVSGDSVESHRAFADKFDLNFVLLSDPNHELINSVGVYGEKNLYGKIVLGLIRSTFLLDADGKITKAWASVKAKGHADQVVKAAR